MEKHFVSKMRSKVVSNMSNLFDENGVIRSIDYFSQTIKKEKNILCEHTILKSVSQTEGNTFDFLMRNMLSQI